MKATQPSAKEIEFASLLSQMTDAQFSRFLEWALEDLRKHSDQRTEA